MRTFRIAAVASVGLLALAGCGTEQGAALFVGDERVSESTVDGYVELAEAANAEAAGTESAIDPASLDLAPNRESAVLCVLFSELGQAMDLPEPDTAAAVDDFDAECTKASGYLDAISADVEPRELTEDELAHMARLGAPFEQLAPEDQAAMMSYAALSDALAGYFEEYDVRVNPRYGVDAFPLLAEGAEGLFEVEIPQR